MMMMLVLYMLLDYSITMLYIMTLYWIVQQLLYSVIVCCEYAFLIHTMIDYTEGLVIGHNTLQFDCYSLYVIVTLTYSLQSPKYKNTYMPMSNCCHRAIASDGRVVNLPSFLPAVMTSSSSSSVGVDMSCHDLQLLAVMSCDQINDASIISISTHCTQLQSLNLNSCRQITDAKIISICTHCTGLHSLNLEGCYQITDASIISISTHFTRLQALNLHGCDQINDASIIPISQNCTGLWRLNVSETAITDASLIAIAKNCTGLQYLDTYDCDGLSSYKLRDEFNSVSKLRAVLLSIYPSLQI